MCIAINKPENVLIPHKHLEESWKRNDDGAGFMYAEDGKLYIEKGFMSFDHFMQAYTPHEAKPAVVHFRITTHGTPNQSNTHPFRVGKTLGFVHNGIISNVNCSTDKTRSDTSHFNEQYLQKMYARDPDFISDPILAELISKYIDRSKLIFLDAEGNSTILNESYGKWDNGVWYSNQSYQPPPPPKPYVPPTHTQMDTRTPPQIVFKQGSEVYVKHPRLKGRGTIQYFTGNTMVGVLMQGDKEVSIVPMQCLELWQEPYKNPYKHDDYVILKSDKELQMGIVKGTSKKTVWVQWLDDYMTPVGSAKPVHAADLEHWDYPLGI